METLFVAFHGIVRIQVPSENNADVNAALQIIKKYFKKSSFEVNESIFNPKVISIS